MKSRATMQQRFVEFAQEMPGRKQQTPEAVAHRINDRGNS